MARNQRPPRHSQWQRPSNTRWDRQHERERQEWEERLMLQIEIEEYRDLAQQYSAEEDYEEPIQKWQF